MPTATNVSAQSTIGFLEFIAQSGLISQILLAILLLMSMVSWSVIFMKIMDVYRINKSNALFLKLFKNTQSLKLIRPKLAQSSANRYCKNTFKGPFLKLTLEGIRTLDLDHTETGLTRALRNVLDEIEALQENGLAILATVSTTAPFVGLFGTVWGIYHALIVISESGAGTIDKIAGPVGESLIMTGIGLAVAIPAVMGHNWCARKNRVMSGRLDSFAYELLTRLLIEKPVHPKIN